MNKFKVIFTAEKIYTANDMDEAQKFAEDDLSKMANPLKADIFSISYVNKHGLYPKEEE